MLGGGSFTAQNKVLPGAYINFVNAASAASMMGTRGTVAVPMVLDWGTEKTVIEMTAEDFSKNSLEVFGYSYDDTRAQTARR